MVAGGVGGALLLAALSGFCWWKKRKRHNSQVTGYHPTIMSTKHLSIPYKALIQVQYRFTANQGTEHISSVRSVVAVPPANE
jgi:hypothetical protein